MKLSKGKMTNRGLKVLVYGPEGIGKSTFASKFPDPIFIDTEGSTTHMDVLRVDPAPASWTEMMMIVDQLGTQYLDGYQTLVLDTADWAERMCMNFICSERNWKSIEDSGYGRAYTYLMELFGKLLNELDGISKKGNNVVITAHAAMRKFEQPDEQGAYDRWELKLQKKTAPLVKEWADAVLFANYKTIVVNVDGQGAAKGKNKVQGGRRVMYTSHHPCWDAKNRFGLADELPFDYEQIAHIVPNKDIDRSMPCEVSNTAAQPSPAPQNPPCEPPKVQTMDTPHPDPAGHLGVAGPAGDPGIDEPVPEELRRLMDMNGVTAREVREVVASVGYFPVDTPIENYGMDFIMGMLVADWEVVCGMIMEMRAQSDDTPF